MSDHVSKDELGDRLAKLSEGLDAAMQPRNSFSKPRVRLYPPRTTTGTLTYLPAGQPSKWHLRIRIAGLIIGMPLAVAAFPLALTVIFFALWVFQLLRYDHLIAKAKTAEQQNYPYRAENFYFEAQIAPYIVMAFAAAVLLSAFSVPYIVASLFVAVALTVLSVAMQKFTVGGNTRLCASIPGASLYTSGT